MNSHDSDVFSADADNYNFCNFWVLLDMAAGPWTFKVCSMDQETVCSNILHISVEGKYFGI